MTYIKTKETYYSILKVDLRATIAEIVAAYHTAKNAFSKDSVATYSLFSADEAKTMLNKLEEAYLTLSNFDKRAEYDRILALQSQNAELPPSMTELELKQNAQLLPKDGAAEAAAFPTFVKPAPPEPPQVVESLDGAALKAIREKRGLSVEDVARITKIPLKIVKALESAQPATLPARVYVQGFIKNLANLYKLEPQSAMKAYLSSVGSTPDADHEKG